MSKFVEQIVEICISKIVKNCRNFADISSKWEEICLGKCTKLVELKKTSQFVETCRKLIEIGRNDVEIGHASFPMRGAAERRAQSYHVFIDH